MLKHDLEFTILVQLETDLQLSPRSDAHGQLTTISVNVKLYGQRSSLQAEVELNLLLNKCQVVPVKTLDDVVDEAIDAKFRQHMQLTEPVGLLPACWFA